MDFEAIDGFHDLCEPITRIHAIRPRHLRAAAQRRHRTEIKDWLAEKRLTRRGWRVRLSGEGEVQNGNPGLYLVELSRVLESTNSQRVSVGEFKLDGR